jgi:enoyl-CoA hydratase
MQLEYVQFEIDDNIGVITLDRPSSANAQSPKVLEELDQAWKAADQDASVKVIVFKSNGKHFSAGHDMSSTEGKTDFGDFKADAHYDWETRHYLHYAKSWRDIPKPSIAAVQGKCIAAGLMLCWPCDLIIAAENAEFSDPVLHMGILGVELHAHTWELGPRKAKELLFTAGSINAEEARQLGMVNKVVPLEQLVPATMEMARRIALMDSFALRMAKRAVNHTMDIQGYTTAIDACFDMHHFGHARAALVTGGMPSLAGLSSMKGKSKA